MALSVPAAVSAQNADFENFLSEIRAEAAAEGISQGVINGALTGIQPVQRILERDRAQAEFKLTLSTYSDRVITDGNVRHGRTLMREHASTLRAVADRYGVQPRFIAAIWGIESRFGAITGDHDVVPAVATLAYDRRRSAFFREQLLSTLRILDRGYIDLPSLKGSWAGAMGQPQFMPSSYMAYAVDFDGDGHRDIWNTEADVFASIANYLKKHGWSDDQTWGREVQVPNGIRNNWSSYVDSGRSGCNAMKTMSQSRTLPEWQAAGVRQMNGLDLPTRPLEARLVAPDGPDGRMFAVYRNYESVLRYNCAHLYGLTVGLLSDRLDDTVEY